ncbi:sulfite exporter TauE/SafE family protein [Pelagibacterium montanilacus]|uniref:sulfite exporter TauE/SafE family protein n=1 Tax=Pelagibacterium montanilacus TaxID=2185280 RepID=UPI000F8EF307|nr:sulfite exporter TauE/SafE family protein [Pelagibacterium montanilacus]
MDLTTILVIFLAIGAGSLVKGATGMGMPLIAIPIMASFVNLQQSISILLVPIIVSNIWQAYACRDQRRDPAMKFLVPMLVCCALGVMAGTWFLTTAPERVLSLCLGVLLLAYLGLRLAKPSFRIGPRSARKWAAPAGLGSGLLHGATGISAPIGVTFIHAMRFPREAHLFAVSSMFLVQALVQAPSLWVAGVLRPEWLIQGLFALVPLALLMPVGEWLSSKLSAGTFDRLILVFLGVIGLKMALGL